METLVDVTIKSVKAGPTGETEHGVWQIHNVLLHESTKKFTYFEKDGEIIPEPGMKIRVFDYESEQKGKFTNHTIKRLTYADNRTVPNDHAPKHSPGPEREISVSQSVMTSYHKDLVVAIIAKIEMGELGLENYRDSTVSLANEFLDASIAAGRRVTQAPKAEPNTDRIEIPTGNTDLKHNSGPEPDGFMDSPDETPEPDNIPF